MLIHPPDDGGLGMAPSEAKKLSISEAAFHLTARDKVERACKAMNRAQEQKTPEQLCAELEAYKRELRLKHTGSEELKA